MSMFDALSILVNHSPGSMSFDSLLFAGFIPEVSYRGSMKTKTIKLYPGFTLYGKAARKT